LSIGWFTGFFGLFGLPSEQHCLSKPWLNVVGLVLAMFALLDSSFVKKGAPAREVDVVAENAISLQSTQTPVEACLTANGAAESNQTNGSDTERYKGMLAAIFAGCCYGSNFLPSTYIQDHTPGASQNGLDYVFNQFCGILAASTVYFLIYCACKGNKPSINPEIVLPGFASGVMWAIAQSCWFVANAELGYAAAFPIILIGPGFIGSMWSVFLFKDIYGQSNYNFLAGYFILAVASCVCIVLSRKSDGDCS
jgi:hypothetical protein